MININGDELPDHISYSSLTDYLACGYMYYLNRVKQVKEIPAWWYLQWNTGKLERQEWNPEENRPGTHQYLNDLETTLIWCRVFTNNTFLVRSVSEYYHSRFGTC